jgi:hypothetical protein
MTNESLSEAYSVLALDIGSVNTRAILFFEADDQYRFIAQGSSLTTLEAPLFNINQGIIQAITKLQATTGAVLLDEQSHLIIPGQPDGAGVDQLVITYSAGTPLRFVTLGLLRDVSLKTANKIASAVSGKIVLDISLNEGLPFSDQLDRILTTQPDILLIAGGIEEGALKSMQELISLLKTLVAVVPRDKMPRIIYAGNSSLAEMFKESLKDSTDLCVVPNVRPAIEVENVSPAREKVAEIVTEIRSQRWNGLRSLENICSFPPIPSSIAYGRILEFLGKSHDPSKGVLGVNLGAGSTIFAASNGIQSDLRVYPYGMGQGLSEWLDLVSPEEVIQWVPEDASWSELKDYLHQKNLFPASIPSTRASLEYEQATARAILAKCMFDFLQEWGMENIAFDPIMISGTTIANTISPWQTLLMILDGLQPVGISTIILDQHGLTASLGAIAEINPLIPVQILESSAFTPLATVVCPFSEESYGTKILRALLEYEDGNFHRFEIKQGSLLQIPLAQGQKANLQFEPIRRVMVDPVIPSYGFKVMGGLCGLVIDARGRPINIPKDAKSRIPLLKKWLTAA